MEKLHVQQHVQKYCIDPDKSNREYRFPLKCGKLPGLHFLDTLIFLACLVLPILVAPTPPNIRLFAWMAVGSCLLITKDEFIHQRLCSGGEHWLHAVLFILHPIVLFATAFLWIGIESAALSRPPGPAMPLAASVAMVASAVTPTGFC